jgi:hypothetical protein
MFTRRVMTTLCCMEVISCPPLRFHWAEVLISMPMEVHLLHPEEKPWLRLVEMPLARMTEGGIHWEGYCRNVIVMLLILGVTPILCTCLLSTRKAEILTVTTGYSTSYTTLS